MQRGNEEGREGNPRRKIFLQPPYAPHYKTLQNNSNTHPSRKIILKPLWVTHCNTLQHTVTRCNTHPSRKIILEPLEVQFSKQAFFLSLDLRWKQVELVTNQRRLHQLSVSETATHCNALHHTARCNPLQHTTNNTQNTTSTQRRYTATHCNTH